MTKMISKMAIGRRRCSDVASDEEDDCKDKFSIATITATTHPITPTGSQQECRNKDRRKTECEHSKSESHS